MAALLALNVAPWAVTVVVAVHFGYLAFVTVGGFAAWARPRLIWLHLAAVAWAASIVVVGQDCPLTWLQRQAESWAGEAPSKQGFIDRYLEGVLYPERYTGQLRLAVAVVILASWIGAAVYRRRSSRTADQPSRPTRARSVQLG